MFTISAFGDEIDAEPVRQLDVLTANHVRILELRSINNINVLDLSDEQILDFNNLLYKRRIAVSAIASPIGKSSINGPFDKQLQLLDRAIELARRFDTPNVRVFSYYQAEEPNCQDEVIRRLTIMTQVAMAAGVRLLHENEHRIYGESPDRVADLLQSVPDLLAIYDPANFVCCGHDPWEGWLACRDRVVHLHIKDWVRGELRGRVAGDGQGRILDVIADAVDRGYDGFATLEPHLIGGGPTGGTTGPELFSSAVEALRNVIRSAGGIERTP